jgi:hypothetical protein
VTITLELPPDLEARFIAEAQAKGIPLQEVVKSYLYYHAPPVRAMSKLSAEEVDKALEEAADLIPEGIQPLCDASMSRNSIYTREDDWDR